MIEIDTIGVMYRPKVDPEAPDVTVALRFADEAEAIAVLGL